MNQKQTYRHERSGGYLWSPKRKRNGHRNPYYEFMREVSPGDLVYSFADAHIPSYAVAVSHAYEAPQPEAFGSTGRRWDKIGWRVDVHYHDLPKPIRPADWIDLLRPLLPKKYSPLLPDGRGSQSVYLTSIPVELSTQLAKLIDRDLVALIRNERVGDFLLPVPPAEHLLWEEHLQNQIEADAELHDTDRTALVLARRGQGLFKERVRDLEARCRITGVDRLEHLRASHCKPWRDSSHEERLDGENGLLLTPSIDHLFDRGFISFADNGVLLVSSVAHQDSLRRMGVPVGGDLDTGRFRPAQSRYLEYHRDEVFLKAQVG